MTVGWQKNFLARGVVRHWSRLFREVVASPSSEVFKPWVDKVLAGMV